MSTLPKGTVTFMMTDVEGSTELWTRNGEVMDREFDVLAAEIHARVRTNGGTIVKSRGEGDSHFAVFDRATAAARAAVEIQRTRAAVAWPAVRIALHTGEAEPRDGDYLGMMVNRTARVRSTANGRQTVCTRVVAELLEGAEGLTVRSLGTYRVRDIPTPTELFQLTAPGTPTEFPPLHAADVTAAPVMTFVVVDQVGSSQRVAAAPGGLAEWQGHLHRALRVAADARDGRFFKFVGDGCVVAFEDPSAAVDFARQVCLSDLGVRAAVAAGVTHVVEGELSSWAIWEAAKRVADAAAGDIWVSPVVDALAGGRTEVQH